MEKITGQELKNDLAATQLKLSNLNTKINKKFDLIIGSYSQFIPDTYKTFLANNSIYDLETHTKLEIIIVTEDNYVNKTGDQVSLFK